MIIPTLLISLYVVLQIVTLWKFMYQRTALSVCRDQDLPTEYKGVMVPYWHIVSAWPSLIIRGILLVLMWIRIAWYVPIILFGIALIISATINIPYAYFLRRMRNRLSDPAVLLVKKECIEENEPLRLELLDAIKSYRLATY